MRKQYGKIGSAKKAKQVRRKLSARKTLVGTTDRPRVCAIKSNKHLVVQVVDDSVNKTLFSIQTYGKNAVPGKANKSGAKLIGTAVAEKLKSAKLTNVVFDRNGNKYTGVVAAIADGLRENGIQV